MELLIQVRLKPTHQPLASLKLSTDLRLPSVRHRTKVRLPFQGRGVSSVCLKSVQRMGLPFALRPHSQSYVELYQFGQGVFVGGFAKPGVERLRTNRGQIATR